MIGDQRSEPRARADRGGGTRRTPFLAGVAAAAFGVAVAGGYGFGWTWTGFRDNTTVWVWLQLLVLPVVITLLPVWYRTHVRLRVEWRALAVLLAATSATLLVGGYELDWTWTGFADKHLWDWLELLVLPLALVGLPIFLSSERRSDRRWRAALAALTAAFGITVLGGYLLDWDWTGFQGNTLWDWLHLLLVPFALPAALIWLAVRPAETVPAASPRS
ncbi:MAG: hypothetical protein ACXVYV_07130 [Gaiellales bacterium]